LKLHYSNAILAIVAAEVDLNMRYPHWRRRKTYGELSLDSSCVRVAQHRGRAAWIMAGLIAPSRYTS